ncbi:MULTISPECIES: DUF2726 domain-containing protein [unclassified Ectothiorhodospira]|uniref:DUF2726 domain-containing protein n=1 Tax=unclassified Ectothiorhodospira TaxID=2684909 RepID=UPI001EE937F8|nr:MULTISPECIES: DUF2726 domain-containing protein [unclassified Ectothiorhodospira]MCG5516279.1 DUF2726 domain-containing protein [Ectothiorhodospira sp. 9100]MCG5518048.1 DUF2726 domain-containing protein [Ectothiorhodospira sp. 9905]
MAEVLIMLVFAGAAIVFYTQYRARVDLPPPNSGAYEREDKLFSPKEVEVLKALEESFANDHRIYPSLLASEVIAVKPTPDQPLKQTAQKRIDDETFDFVLCKKDSFDVVCAIRCRSAQRKGLVHDPDDFLEEVCAHIELPLGVIRIDQPITAAKAKTAVEEAIKAVADRAEEAKARKARAEEQRKKAAEEKKAAQAKKAAAKSGPAGRPVPSKAAAPSTAKPESKPEPKSEPKPETKPEVKAEAKPPETPAGQGAAAAPAGEPAKTAGKTDEPAKPRSGPVSSPSSSS